MKRILDAIRRAVTPGASTRYRIVTTAEETGGWQEDGTARRQHAAWSRLLIEMKAGEPRSDLVTAADALRATSLTNPSVVEIGCGTGYYTEVFATLFGPVRYVGIDYSPAMVRLARNAYPGQRFLVADGTRLPMRDGSCDVAFSGNSLMHIPQFAAAITETARITTRWCVFHSVPVLENRETTMLRKQAYGAELFEIVFNRAHLEDTFARSGLRIEKMTESVPYDIARQVGEQAREVTYVCSRM